VTTRRTTTHHLVRIICDRTTSRLALCHAFC
jgi:hypothetical protein